MAAYWDTSCVLKLYCRESDSEAYLDRLSRATQPLLSSALLEAELYYAFHQKAQRDETGGLSANELFEAFASDISRSRFSLCPIGSDVVRESRRVAQLCFAGSPPVFLRSLDGLHLATARLLDCDEVLSTDDRMRAACDLLGFR